MNHWRGQRILLHASVLVIDLWKGSYGVAALCVNVKRGAQIRPLYVLSDMQHQIYRLMTHCNAFERPTQMLQGLDSKLKEYHCCDTS